MKRKKVTRRAIPWRTAGALCVLAMLIFGVVAGAHFLEPGNSTAFDRITSQKNAAATASDNPSEGDSVEPGGGSHRCDSCDARHRHIVRLREVNP